ncbi:MAG: protein-methionine-sulfoxide reductase catalytic subunit MsrP [Bdellovibrio sp.]
MSKQKLFQTKLGERDITPEIIYENRRRFIGQSGLWIAAAGLSSMLPEKLFGKTASTPPPSPVQNLPAKLNSLYNPQSADRPLTQEKLATSYNNFYEFSLEKDEPKELAQKWTPQNPWTIEVTGLTDEKKTYTLDELIKLGGGLEERIYRFRCVEAWSMVVPWTGFELAKLIPKLKPKSTAKYVAFTSYGHPEHFPNIKKMPYYPWPYTEGLLLSEAMHPLTLLATGLYGKPMPQQNGAPLRLVVPWKYGFKSIKSIVKIEFADREPKTLWNQLAPKEYGFLANVNPEVDHPRWSQSSERVLDGKIFPTRIKTLKFNGYEKEVASLYAGMDLKKLY